MAKMRQNSTKEVVIRKTFVPRLWEEIDGRYAIAKEIRRRYQTLKQDTGSSKSQQRDMLCQRAVFMGVCLETMEVEAVRTGNYDAGVYTQMSNALLGLLKALGLDRPNRSAEDFQTYLAERIVRRIDAT